MVPRFHRRRRWPLQIAAIFATSGIVALGFKAWVEDQRGSRLAAEIRRLRAPRADDNWTWCTSTVARGADPADPAQVVRRSYEQGFRAFEIVLPTPAHAGRLIEIARDYPTAHWLPVAAGDPRATLDAYVAAAIGQMPGLLDRTHPVITQPEDVPYALRVYPFPSLVYAPTNPAPSMALFVRDAGLGVVVLPRENLSREVVAALAGAGARTYIAGVNDSAEAREFHDWGAVGVVTDSLPPKVTCRPMLEG
jgi:hypothetical protein